VSIAINLSETARLSGQDTSAQMYTNIRQLSGRMGKERDGKRIEDVGDAKMLFADDTEKTRVV